MGHIGYVKSKGDINDMSSDDLCFLIWKAELNKELMAFWKSITEES